MNDYLITIELRRTINGEVHRISTMFDGKEIEDDNTDFINLTIAKMRHSLKQIKKKRKKKNEPTT